MVINEWQDMIDLMSHEDLVFLATCVNASMPGFSNLSRVPKPLRGRLVQAVKKRINNKRYSADTKKAFGNGKQPEYNFSEINDKIEHSKYSTMKLLILFKIFKPNNDSETVDEIFKKYFYQQDINFTEEEKKRLPNPESKQAAPAEDNAADTVKKDEEVKEETREEIREEIKEEPKEEPKEESCEDTIEKKNDEVTEAAEVTEVTELKGATEITEITEKAETSNDEPQQYVADDVKTNITASENTAEVKQDAKINKKYIKLEKENEELKKKLENVTKDFQEKKKKISELERQVRECNLIVRDKDREVEAIRNKMAAMQGKIDELTAINSALREEIKYAQYPGVLIWSEEEDEYSGIKNIRKIVAVPSNDSDRNKIVEAIKKYNIKEIWYVKAGHSFGESRRMKELVKEQGVALIDKRLWEVR